MRDGALIATGGAAVTSPAWFEYLMHILPVVWQTSVAVAGGTLIFVTLYTKILEMMQRRRDLKN